VVQLIDIKKPSDGSRLIKPFSPTSLLLRQKLRGTLANSELLTNLAIKKAAGKAIDLTIKDLPYYEVTYTLKQSFDLVEKYKKILADRAIDTRDWFEVWSQ
jgi:hypothetical protein